MELNEKELIEKAKSIEMNNLFMKEMYIDLYIQSSWRQAYIIDMKPNNKYDIVFLSPQEQIKRKNDIPFSSLSIIGENTNTPENIKRNRCLNSNIFQMETEEVIYYLNQAITDLNIDLEKYELTNIENNNKENVDETDIKKNNDTDIYNGCYMHQFLSGIFIDCLAFIYNEIDPDKPNKSLEELSLICLDIFIFVIEIIKNNLHKYKILINNRKLLILDKIYAIIASFELILANINFMFLVNFSNNELIIEKKSKIINTCYQLILNNKTNYYIPIPILVELIQFITMNNITKKSIIKFQQTAVFQVYLKSIENLTETEIKNIKKLNKIKNYSIDVTKCLFNQNNNTKLVNQCYYSALLLCIKCNILEKKMAALACLNEIFGEKEFNNYFYEFFIEKNKILDLFFEESTHDEVIKRSIDLFKYLAKYDKLNEDIINKLIQADDNKEIYKNIIIDVLFELPIDKKTYLFQNITKKLNFNNNSNDIDYLLKLVEACLKPNERKSNKKEEQNKNKDKDSENKKDVKDDKDGKDGKDEKKEKDEKKDKDDKKEKDEKDGKNQKKEKDGKDEKENLVERSYNVGLDGLNLLFKYIIKDFDINKSYDKNNVDKAIEQFNKVKYLKANDIVNYIEKLFEVIKSDENHKSVVQCIMLITKLINQLNDKKEYDEKNLFKNLENKFTIFNLIINDLNRYIKIIIDKNEKPEPNKIYEGIYSHILNIETRFKFIFFFVKGNTSNEGLELDSKNHLEKIYSILKHPLFNKELYKFMYIFTINLNYFSNDIINEFLDNVIQNKNEFDLANFTNKEILYFINKAFKKINKEEGIIYNDSKNDRVKKDNIKKLDLLFDILINNKNSEIQNNICDNLTKLCLYLYDYKTDFCQKYWNNYIEKITNLFENLQKDKNYNGLIGIIKLIDNIYSLSSNFGGKIPRKEDTHTAEEPFELYHFCCPMKKKKEYKIRVGEKDKILQMRWKLGYYYDIPINDVVFEDKNKERYTFKDEETYFYEIFPPEIYCPEDKNYVLVNVYSVPDQFLAIDGNPKELIEKNEIIFNNLIQNLYIDVLTDIEMKQKIWNILSKFPKNIYINNQIKKFGEENKIDENIVKKIFNIKEVYILTYTLQCIKEYISDKNIKNKFLNNFINIHHGDELLYNILLDANMDQNNCKLIEYECLTIIMDLLKIIEDYKKENKDEENIIKKISKDKLFNKISLIIIDLIKIKYDILYKNSHYNKYDIIDSVEEDDEKNNNSNIKKINKMMLDLLENILNFTEQTTNDNSYIEYIFNNKDIFKKIFFYDYIKCEKEEMKKILEKYLSNHLFQKNEDKFIKNYFDIMLSVKAFNELVNNDTNGSYFKELSSLMKKYQEKNKEKEKNEIDEKHMEQFTQIIDSIINYIQIQCDKAGFFKNFEIEETKIENNDDCFKDSKIEGILIFLKNILNLSPKILVNYLINKIDIYDIFLIKCILRKCNKNPLETQKMLCVTNKSRKAMFNLIIFILRNIPEENNDLQIKIWEILDNHHKIGFWKTNKDSDWKLEPNEIYQKKYIGLKNMTSTCYMNSIIQQFFMIPMLRETILSIENSNKDNVLYQLQLLFSALKTYEYKYYNPKPFVIKSGLNFYEQMDADEYYGQAIDRIENDIKSLYPNSDECPYKDLFKFFFGIKVLDELKFVDCGHKRYNEFYYNNIQLEIKGVNNIFESLKNYCKTEIMDGDNKINCEECNTKRTCHKRLVFKSLPNILFIVLKRFEFDYDTMLKIKLNDYFEFPFELDMKNFLIEENSEKNTFYELTGITIHDGIADSGHYYDLIKGQDGNWYKFNDTIVKIFSKDKIPEEAFGDKNAEDELDKDESDEDKNNAYILIYTKKNFDKEKIENLESNFKTKLALPPYTKFGNINKENKSIINCQMFKYWTLENIINPSYQEFILNLLKIDLVKNYNKNVEKKHPELFKELKDEEYLINNTKDKEENKENIEIEKNNKIFQYGLRYYFNIMLRTSIKEREYMSKYDEIIKTYIESDSDKCQYVLEELSDNDAINEYLVFCPVEENVKYSIGIIITAFKNYLNDKNINDKTLLFKYINGLLLFVHYNIDNINLEYVLNLINQLIHINKDKQFIKYLKEKNVELWIFTLEKEEMTEEDETNNDLIMSEDNLPIIKSTHYILTQKTKLEEDPVKDNNRESEFGLANEKRLKDISINFRLIRKLGYDLYKEK